MLEHSPRFDLRDAERVAREHFGAEGRATALTSERDQNFSVEGANGARFVLKIANAREDRAMLEAQQQALMHVAQHVDVTPRVMPATSGDTLVEVTAPDGRSHLAWAISWLPGRPLAIASRKSRELLEDFGRNIGALAVALATFDSPAIHRDFYWDLANGRAIVARFRDLIADAELGRTIDDLMESFDVHTAPLLAGLPRAAIHGDPNDYNVLVGGGTDPESRDQRVTGFVDFGDMTYSYRIGDLAIALAYVLCGESDPLVAADAMVRGYSEALAPTDDELAALFGLVVLRLCTSVCIAADQQRQRPDNEYLGVSQQAIVRALPILAAIPFPLAESAFRGAAGVGRTAAAKRAIAYLEKQPSIVPILGINPQTSASLVLDLGVGSSLISGDASDNAEPLVTARVASAMRRAEVPLAIGRYDEARLIYTDAAFATASGSYAERRSIHIGLDLFAPVGTPVFAPLDGAVHAFADNRAPQDYGPVIVLRHQTDDGTEFFTLYGHLSRKSLDGLAAGATVSAGDRIATLGPAAVNGGWTPHLHFQLITNILGLGSDFPGVAAPSQRAAWLALCPDPNLIARVPADRFPPREPSAGATLAARRAVIGGNLSIAYREHVKVVRGWMQHLYDENGRRYLDAYNNVPHVGHCHPRVVDAAVAQMRLLNTNTRYLNDLLAEYADRLLATLPPALDVCYILNSASEANELALRLARAYTGQKDMIVLEAAYHGNTTSLVDISPYKHAGPGGSGAPDWVHVAALPDVYRGAFRASDPNAGAKYASSVRDAERGVAGFIAETCPSVGGQLILPQGYLAHVYEHVRAAGGVCIADEVQTGLGRLGTSFWAFEDQHVVPDMVVMGKPLGNGHPVAAVATTRAIASAFDNGMEFFSTFGGNTVSCAVGIAVLDVVRDEALQAHAHTTGEQLAGQLRALRDRHQIVGDVRGSGLFWGVELVRDRETLEPAGAEASFVANRMREQGILLGTDGPHHNVVKIRPPMPFSGDDGEILADALDRALRQLGAQ
ncbi:MAG: aminotransferase class III-fold pyridoxal phosphate-dependent enzyme [Gemmatimonadota bacterium]|nr:aminotransferase class III-fold pyridoxal phosphate-dependent enzyme [Gemmatimonadota bacterium]